MSRPIKLEAECNKCHSRTLHDVLFVKEDGGREDIAEDCFIDEGGEDIAVDCFIEWGKTWRVIQCRGCESISMLLDSWNSEATEHDGRPEVSRTYFPPRTFREFPAWLDRCPGEVEKLMRELYIALQNDCNAAATLLMRAALEHTMIDKIGDRGGFEAKLNAFEQQGYINKEQKGVVESMLEAGHAAIHRAFIPQKIDIVALADMLEVVLKVIYVQAPKAEEINKRIPKRKNHKPPSSPAPPPSTAPPIKG
jgi:hypothetical protein